MRNGDFSALLALGPQVPDLRPGDDPARSRYSRPVHSQPARRQCHPGEPDDPVAKRILSYWGLPNVSGTADGRDNFQVPNFVEEQTTDTVTARVDHNFSPNHRMYRPAELVVVGQHQG